MQSQDWAFTFTWWVRPVKPHMKEQTFYRHLVILDFANKFSPTKSTSTVRIDLIICADNASLLCTAPREFLKTKALALTGNKSRGCTVISDDIEETAYPFNKRYYVICDIELKRKLPFQESLKHVFTYNPGEKVKPRGKGPSYRIYADADEYNATIGVNEMSYENFIAAVKQQWEELNKLH